MSDLHDDLRTLDWVLAQAADVDLCVVAGDVLDAGSPVPLGAQIGVLLEYLERCARQSSAAVCSGYHDLDRRTATGDKATAWIVEALPAASSSTVIRPRWAAGP